MRASFLFPLLRSSRGDAGFTSGGRSRISRRRRVEGVKDEGVHPVGRGSGTRVAMHKGKGRKPLLPFLAGSILVRRLRPSPQDRNGHCLPTKCSTTFRFPPRNFSQRSGASEYFQVHNFIVNSAPEFGNRSYEPRVRKEFHRARQVINEKDGMYIREQRDRISRE